MVVFEQTRWKSSEVSVIRSRMKFMITISLCSRKKKNISPVSFDVYQIIV